MNSSVLLAVIAVVAVALLSMFMRRARPADPDMPALPVMDEEPPGAPERDEEDAPADADEDSYGDSGEVVAVSSDGLAFVALGEDGTVRLSPAPGNPWSSGPEVRLPAETLRPGDLIAARVKRGAPDHDPWRIEALGRDRELRAWRFETEEAARTALELLERCIVRAPRDENDDEIPVGDEAYDEARRLEEEIERELASMPDVGEDAADSARRPIE